MVLDSTLLAVNAALSSEIRPLPEIADEVKLEKGTVRNALNLLIRLGIAEKVEHEPQASRKKGGWVTVGYRSIAIQSIAIKNEA